MATKTVRPSSTTGSTNSEAVGAASRHAALNDDSDSSYLVTTGLNTFSQTGLGLPDLELPAGSLIKSVAIRVRTRKLLVSESLAVGLTGTGWTLGHQVVSWSNFTTATAMFEDKARTEAEVNAADLSIELPTANIRMAEAYLDVNYVPKPTVGSITPTGATSDNTPLVSWVPGLDAEGGPQNSYQLKVFNSATYGGGGFNPESSTATFNSGVQDGPSRSHEVSTPLANTTYKSYIRVSQVVHGEIIWSEWTASSTFTVSAPLPNKPEFTLTPEDSQGRIKVKLEEGSGGTKSADIYQLQKTEDGGATWYDVRTLVDGGILDAPTETIWDYEAGIGASVKYRARSYNETEHSTSEWVESSATSWTSTDIWIKNPFLPWMNWSSPAGGRVRSFPAQTRDTGATVHKVLGRPDPIVTRDEGGPMWENGELVVMIEEESEEFEALKESGSALLLQFPDGTDERDRYFTLTGSLQSARIIDKSFVTLRDHTLNWQEVAEPSGPVEEW